MDDGCLTGGAKGVQERTRDGSGRIEFCVQAMEPTSRERLVAYLADTWGIRPRLKHRGARRQASLIFPKVETAKFLALVAPFVHPAMGHNHLPKHRVRFVAVRVFSPIPHDL